LAEVRVLGDEATDFWVVEACLCEETTVRRSFPTTVVSSPMQPLAWQPFRPDAR
jgi:hypothetical protein